MTRVLVFQGDQAFAKELRIEVGRCGVTVQVVDDGELGLRAAIADRPDLILLSIELPRGGGFAVCNRLKKDPGLSKVPVVITSSESSDETFEQHRKLRARAQDYLHRPIAVGELMRRIGRYLPERGGPFRVRGPADASTVAAVEGDRRTRAREQRRVALAPNAWNRLKTLAEVLRDECGISVSAEELAALLVEKSIDGITATEVGHLVGQRRAARRGVAPILRDRQARL